jgi:hypothetical protein
MEKSSYQTLQREDHMERTLRKRKKKQKRKHSDLGLRDIGSLL